MKQESHPRIVIVGGGTAGISVAARLRRKLKRADVTVIEPSSKHYYQPLWTLVGAGVFSKQTTQREESSVIPRGVSWIQDAVTEIRPDENVVVTRNKTRVDYDFLVVAPGLQMNWDKVKGLREGLGHEGVCSNYSYQYVDKTWETIRRFAGGVALFTHPATPIKCGGAPQKIMYLADDHFRKSAVREKSRIIFAAGVDTIFAVKRYAETLDKVIARKGIETRFKHDLVEVRAASKEAVFRRMDTGEEVVIAYDMLHVTPPMGPPDFVRNGPLANAEGWIDVDKSTLQHVRYANVFSLGDASGLPTSKTGAAIRKQAPALVENLVAASRGLPLTAKYDGYTSCPLVTGYGKLVLAEFDYDKTPKETFPVDQSKERLSMYLLKAYGLPLFYWHGMLKGRM